MKDVNYIVAFYNGTRRHYGRETHWRTFLHAHIDFITNNMIDIGKVTFLISWSNDNNDFKDDKEMIWYIESLDLPFNYETYTRVNNGFSYGAFAEVIEYNHKDYKYSFIIEDDYIPTSPDFMGYFLRKLEGSVVYVPSLYKDSHASICNGMINNKLLIDNIRLLGDYHGKDYRRGGYTNQRKFMTGYGKLGYTFDDITDVAHTEYLDSSKRIIKYGNENGPLLIKPICV